MNLPSGDIFGEKRKRDEQKFPKQKKTATSSLS